MNRPDFDKLTDREEQQLGDYIRNRLNRHFAEQSAAERQIELGCEEESENNNEAI